MFLSGADPGSRQPGKLPFGLEVAWVAADGLVPVTSSAGYERQQRPMNSLSDQRQVLGQNHCQPNW